MPAAAPATLAPPAGALWVPMSTVGSIAPSWALGQVGGVVPSAALPQIILPPAVPTPPPMQPPTQPVAPVSRVPASCGCNGVRPSQTMAPPNSQMAFAIGRLYYDFGTEARLDYFVQTITHWRDNLRDPVSGAPIGDAAFGVDRDKSGDLAAPYNPEILARYLNNFPQGVEHALVPPNWQDAAAIIWTQTIDAVPIYAVKPFDVFGLGFYASLLAALYNQEVSSAAPGDPASYKKPKKDEGEEYDAPQIDPLVERVVFAGYLDGSTTKLLNGTVVPTLINDWRGFYQWNLEILLGPRPQWPEGVETFLERIYNEFRNVGVSPQDRALNYSAINAHNTKEIFFQMAQKKMRLDNVEVDRSTICRPDSDCWDVTYRFFDPSNVLTQARKVFQYTIDVSDVVPVAVGKLRKWEVY